MNETAIVAEAYARGRVTFMDLDLAVAPGALVPRSETELLGRTAVEVLRGLNAARPRVVDMCCGVGNLACAIAHHVPAATVWASDLTESCVGLARRNVDVHALSARVTVCRGDLFEPLADFGLDGTIDVIVCNPPYISDKRLDSDRAHLLEREPREAFAAGPYGLAIHLRVVREAIVYLRPGGMLLFEVGLGQDRQVGMLLDRSKAYEELRVVRNDAGEGRVIMAARKRCAT